MIKQTRVLLVTLGVFLATAGTGAAEEPQGPPPPPARKIPGITIDDEKPRGCVDCHTNDVEHKMDHRFSTLINEWQTEAPKELVAKAKDAAPRGMEIKGKHPKLKADLTTAEIPDTCLECHAEHPRNKQKKGPPFAHLMHRIHLVGGQDNHFLTYYQGECTYCHKLDMKTGHWELGSGTEKP